MKMKCVVCSRWGHFESKMCKKKILVTSGIPTLSFTSLMADLSQNINRFYVLKSAFNEVNDWAQNMQILSFFSDQNF